MFVLCNVEGKPGINQTIERLKSNASSLDAVEAGLILSENDPKFRWTGYGGDPNCFEDMEFDAAIMDGRTLKIGAVAALRNILPAITVARAVMEKTDHCLIVGEGALILARELGLLETELVSPEARIRYEKFLESKSLSAQEIKNIPNLSQILFGNENTSSSRDTTVYIASDFEGNFAAGTSTCGWSFKYPGRVGDSPVAGAGFYVKNSIGGALCTHTGEMAIRICGANTICTLMRLGYSVEQAVRETAKQLDELVGGAIGPVVLYAVDSDQNHFVGAYNADYKPTFLLWKDGMSGFEEMESVPLS